MINLIKLCLLSLTLSFSGILLSSTSNLLEAKIHKIIGTKRSIYYQNGIFFKNSDQGLTKLVNVRHNFAAKQSYERIVFDFDSASVPKTYIFVDKNQKILYFDIEQGFIGDHIPSVNSSKFIKLIDFYPLGDGLLSFEIKLKKSGQFEIFYLENPGRLVVDIQKDTIN